MEFTILPVTPYQQNCSLVWDEAGRAALIDPGGEARRLLAEVAQRDLKLESILLTQPTAPPTTMPVTNAAPSS